MASGTFRVCFFVFGFRAFQVSVVFWGLGVSFFFWQAFSMAWGFGFGGVLGVVRRAYKV